jgi:hypothetical protein
VHCSEWVVRLALTCRGDVPIQNVWGAQSSGEGCLKQSATVLFPKVGPSLAGVGEDAPPRCRGLLPVLDGIRPYGHCPSRFKLAGKDRHHFSVIHRRCWPAAPPRFRTLRSARRASLTATSGHSRCYSITSSAHGNEDCGMVSPGPLPILSLKEGRGRSAHLRLSPERERECLSSSPSVFDP